VEVKTLHPEYFLSVPGLSLYTLSFNIPHKEESYGFKSGERGGNYPLLIIIVTKNTL
jgi:hypothetical protein